MLRIDRALKFARHVGPVADAAVAAVGLPELIQPSSSPFNESKWAWTMIDRACDLAFERQVGYFRPSRCSLLGNHRWPHRRHAWHEALA